MKVKNRTTQINVHINLPKGFKFRLNPTLAPIQKFSPVVKFIVMFLLTTPLKSVPNSLQSDGMSRYIVLWFNRYTSYPTFSKIKMTFKHKKLSNKNAVNGREDLILKNHAFLVFAHSLFTIVKSTNFVGNIYIFAD